MKIAYVVYYTDGTSGMVEFERPSGAHPESDYTAVEGIRVAEKSGKTVDRLGVAHVNSLSKPPRRLEVKENLKTRISLAQYL